MCDGKHLWHFLHSKVHISFDIKENCICHPKIWPLRNKTNPPTDTYKPIHTVTTITTPTAPTETNRPRAFWLTVDVEWDLRWLIILGHFLSTEYMGLCIVRWPLCDKLESDRVQCCGTMRAARSNIVCHCPAGYLQSTGTASHATALNGARTMARWQGVVVAAAVGWWCRSYCTL